MKFPLYCLKSGVLFRLQCCFLLCLAAVHGAPPSETYTIKGRVEFKSGEAVVGAELALTRNGYEEVTDPVLSDSNGDFVFTGLPKGTYILSAARPDFGSVFLGQQPNSTQVRALSVGPELPVSEVRFVLEKPSVLTGIVRDEHGAPLERANVQLDRRVWADGTAKFLLQNSASTDDQGKFRFGRLRRGRYRVCVTSMQNQQDAAVAVGFVDFSATPGAIYSSACSPETERDFLLVQGRKPVWTLRRMRPGRCALQERSSTSRREKAWACGSSMPMGPREPRFGPG